MNNKFIKRAILLSKQSVETNGGPFGAIVTRQDEIIGEGMNRVTIENDCSLHAEVVAMRAAQKKLNSFSLKGLEYAKTFSDLTAVSLSQEEFDKLSPEYDAVLVRFNTRVGTSVLNKESNIRAVISPTTGLDHIDTKSAGGTSSLRPGETYRYVARADRVP